jgi:hypothetical protein
MAAGLSQGEQTMKNASPAAIAVLAALGVSAESVSEANGVKLEAAILQAGESARTQARAEGVKEGETQGARRRRARPSASASGVLAHAEAKERMLARDAPRPRDRHDVEAAKKLLAAAPKQAGSGALAALMAGSNPKVGATRHRVETEQPKIDTQGIVRARPAGPRLADEGPAARKNLHNSHRRRDMTEKVETLHAAGFLISEAEGNRSRDNIVLAQRPEPRRGRGARALVTAGTATGAADAGNTGTSTIGTVSAGGGAKEGVYTIVMVGAGATAPFEVQDPDGVQIGDGKIGTAFAGDVVFTITNVGGTTVAGDRYTVTVSQLTRKYKILAPAAVPTARSAPRVLLVDTDATSADKAAWCSRAGRGERERAGVAGRHHGGAEGHRHRAAARALGILSALARRVRRPLSNLSSQEKT